MSCQPIYDEMMSLKLDNLLGPDEERHFQVHIAECLDCASEWAAMSEADALLCASAVAPVPVPAHFHASVMLKISQVQVYRPQVAELAAAPAPALVPVPVFAPALGSILPATPSHAHAAPGPDEDRWQEWQHLLSQYLRGAAAVGLSVAGTAGLVIALVLTGTIEVSGPFAGFVGMVRTFLAAVNTWLGSVFAGVGGATVAGLSLVMGVMVLVAWQLVAAYHRTADMEIGNVGQFAEAVS